MSKIRFVLRGAWQDCILKLRSFRYISAFVMVLGLAAAVTSGIDRLMERVGEGITIWMVPHIFSNVFFATFYGLVICYLFSDVPFFNQKELFSIVRQGRICWYLRKIISMILSTFIFTVISFAICILVFIPHISFQKDWGKMIYTMAYSGNLYAYNIMAQPSPAIISKYTPLEALLLCFLMVWLISIMIGLLMFTISILVNRVAALSIMAGIALVSLSDGVFFTVKWLPYITIFSWYRLSTYGEQLFLDWNYPELSEYQWIIACILVISFIVSMIRICYIEFDWVRED